MNAQTITTPSVFSPSTFNECSFLPSDASLNETSFVFYNKNETTTNTNNSSDKDNIDNNCNITLTAAEPTVEIRSETVYVEVTTGRYFI